MDENVAALMGLLYYVTTPKSIFIPEYSNLHNWFFALMVLCLLRYFGAKDSEGRQTAGELRWLVLAGIFMTCDVLAYPSMVLVFFVLPGISAGAQIREKMERTLCLCTVLCGKCGSNVYISSELYDTAENVGDGRRDPVGEGSHQTTVGEKLLGWGSSLGEMAMILLCALLVSLGIRWFIEKVWKKNFPDCYSFRACCFS